MDQTKQVRRWTEAEQQLLLDEIKEGKSTEEIAEAHKRSVGAVCIRRRVLGAKMVANDGKSKEEAARMVGLEPMDIEKQIEIQEYTKNDSKLHIVKRKLLEILDIL